MRLNYVTMNQLNSLRGLSGLPTRPMEIVALMDTYFNSPMMMSPDDRDKLFEWTDRNGVKPED